jgi:cell division septation protein DedD
VDVPEEPASLRDVDLGAGGAGSADAVRASPVAAAVAHAADAPTPSPASGARSAHLYYVQFSAQRDRAEAVSEAERLGAALGRPTRVVAADVPRQGLYYRVLVGEFASKAEAERFRREAESRGSRVGPVHRIAAAPEEQTSDR